MKTPSPETAIRLEGVGKRYDIASDHSRESFPRAVLRGLTGSKTAGLSGPCARSSWRSAAARPSA